MIQKWSARAIASVLGRWLPQRSAPERLAIHLRVSREHAPDRTPWRRASSLRAFPRGIAPRPLEHPLAYAARARQTTERAAVQLVQWQFFDVHIESMRQMLEPHGTPHLMAKDLSKYANEFGAQDGAGYGPYNMEARVVRELLHPARMGMKFQALSGVR